MELRSNLKLLNYTRKFLLNDTDSILPYAVRPQKPAAAGKAPLPLPRGDARAEGVSPDALDTLLRALSGEVGGTHTCMVLRHGKVLCEAEYAPYTLRRWHVTHSMCKSVTGTAVGMLLDEGLLSLDEHICEIFPEKCTLLTSRRMRAVTVRHLLSMRSGVNFREAGSVLEGDWVKAFFDADVLFEPGEAFDYNSMNSYLLAAIVQKKTGESLMDYLRPRLFEPLGFGDVAWEICPQGLAKGGWGLYVYLEDMAKLGQLYLQKGVWKGADGVERRLFSEAWAEAAATPYSATEKGEEYGYQLWPCSAEGIYSFNGMFGQYVVVAPALDMVVAVNAGAANLFVLSKSFAAVLDFLHAAANAPDALPADPDTDARLAYTLSHLRFAAPVPQPPASERPSLLARLRAALFASKPQPAPPHIPPEVRPALAKSYALEPNRVSLVPTMTACMEDWYTKGAERLAFEVCGDALTLLWHESGVTHRIPVGFDEAAESVLDFGGNLFSVGVLGRFTADEDEHPVLKLTVCFLESTSTRLLKCVFEPDGALTVKLNESPALLTAMESLRDTMKTSVPNTELFKDLGYLQYLVRRTCTPVLHGAAESSAPQGA